jgi:hypothetical protein
MVSKVSKVSSRFSRVSSRFSRKKETIADDKGAIMIETLQQIEDNINGLLDIYDQAIEDRNKTKNIDEEKQHDDMAMKTVECIQHELAKIPKLSTFQAEYRISSALFKSNEVSEEKGLQ